MDKTSEEKKEYEVLPIGSVIARLVKLLEHGDNKTCKFKDVLIAKEKFRCYTRRLQERRKAIDKINKTTLDMSKKRKEELGTGINHPLKELEEMFQSDTNVPDKKKKKNLNLRTRKHLPMNCEIDAESNLSEDYSDYDWTPSMRGNKFSR